MTRARKHTVLSLDLAVRSYRDMGAALVSADSAGRLEARGVSLPQTDEVQVDVLVDWIDMIAEHHRVAVVAIDGPLAWRAPDTDSPHARLAERAVNAPGKTGLPPDGAKPRTYLAFTQFSIALAQRLSERAWEPITAMSARVGRRVLVETFPTAAWRALGLRPLPGKSRSNAADIVDGFARLRSTVPLDSDGISTHDDVQAVVGGIAPAWWAAGLRERVALAGVAPFRLDGSWREGHIMIPATINGWRAAAIPSRASQSD